MPKKIIFDFVDAKLRDQMIRDFYSYKKVFIPLAHRTSLTSDDIAKVVASLRAYCVSLIQTSIAHGVETLQHGIYTPYPVGTSLHSIEQDLTK